MAKLMKDTEVQKLLARKIIDVGLQDELLGISKSKKSIQSYSSDSSKSARVSAIHCSIGNCPCSLMVLEMVRRLPC